VRTAGRRRVRKPDPDLGKANTSRTLVRQILLVDWWTQGTKKSVIEGDMREEHAAGQLWRARKS
jgi:hypothetical protein